MLATRRGFTLIELMFVVFAIGILVAIAIPNYFRAAQQAKVAQVKTAMHIVQVSVEDFSTRNNGDYPEDATTLTVEGGRTLITLLPGGEMPNNPFTENPITLDWTQALGSMPTTDPAGGISLNVSQSAPGGVFDTYDIVGADGSNAQISWVASNH